MTAHFKIRVNGAIRGTPQVRVIASNGIMLGVLTLAEALRAAMAEGLDLVEVNPLADPPICRIMDFTRYKRDARNPPAPPIGWTAFELDGRAFEYTVYSGKLQAEGNAPVERIFVSVRERGDPGGGSAMHFPKGTEITLEHAREVARLEWLPPL